jgi:hypothetical protein
VADGSAVIQEAEQHVPRVVWGGAEQHYRRVVWGESEVEPTLLEDLTKQPKDVCVQRGAKLLDEECPGWHNQINLEYLSLPSTNHCVLGQLYDGYTRGCEKLDLGFIDVVNYGFCASVGIETSARMKQIYARLDDCWTEQVQQRREDDDWQRAVKCLEAVNA